MSSNRITTRKAASADVAAIGLLLAPEVAAGTILPMEIRPEDFLVAELDGETLVGAVAMRRWTDDVIELGSLVSGRSGLGVGRHLVQAVLERASQTGFRSVVALTSLDGWFGRLGFSPHALHPWALAHRQPLLLSGSAHHIDSAVSWKAESACAHCTRLATCQQHLMVRAVSARRRKVA
jgi:N-acetylglutamate synthase-like GNAT family acetyltransferase